MKRNMGTTDRTIRTVAGVALLGLGYAAGWGWIAYAIAAVLLVTAAVGFCPPYALLGMNTCGTKPSSSH